MLSLEGADVALLVMMLFAWGPAWHDEGDDGDTDLRDCSRESCVSVPWCCRALE